MTTFPPYPDVVDCPPAVLPGHGGVDGDGQAGVDAGGVQPQEGGGGHGGEEQGEHEVDSHFAVFSPVPVIRHVAGSYSCSSVLSEFAVFHVPK